MSIKIMVVDEHKILREGLSTLIAKQPEMEIIGEATDGREALQLLEKNTPDLILMDVTMPNLNGIEATRKIKAKKPGIEIIALSLHSDRRYVLGMIDAGASGYLLKECAFEELVRAINTVMSKKKYLSPGISDILIDEYVKKTTTDKPTIYSKLTPREREILQLIAEGKNTKEIARYLFISVKTVETHRRHIKKKLKVDSVAELTKIAIREGLTVL
ncbi:MAG: response regulator transcription factor [candidate division WOR-3 bacterium]